MFLVDTHVVAWMTVDKARLTPQVTTALRESSRSGLGIAMASTSLWELAMMERRDRMRFPGSLVEYLKQVESRFIVLPITGAIAVRSMEFSKSFPKDPSDRIIAATAVVHGLRLVTEDSDIRRSGEVECVW